MFRRRFANDEQTVRRVLGGDREAYGILVERYAGLMHGLAYAHLGNHADAEDAVQEAFLKAYRSLDTLREVGRFGPWLVTITRNLCQSMLRRPKREVASAELPDVAVPAPDVAREELRGILRQQLGALEPDQREVLVLHYFGQKKTHEIAALLEISHSAAKMRLKRSRELLGRRMVAQLDEALAPPQEPQDRTRRIMGAVAGLPVTRAASLAGATASAKAAGGLASAVAVAKALLGAVAVTAVVSGGLWAFSASEKSLGLPREVAQASIPAVPAAPAAETTTVSPPPAPDSAEPASAEPAPPATSSSAEGGTVTGRVYDADSGRGLAGVHVWTPTEGQEGSAREAETDKDGNYRFAPLPEGEYEFRLRPVEGYADSPTNEPVQRAVVRKDAGITGLDFALTQGNVIAGVLVDPEGKPVPDAQVTGSTNVDRYYQAQDKTKSDGSFLLAGFPDTTEAFVCAWMPSGNRVAPPQGPLAVNREGIHGLRLVMVPGATVTGRVLDSAGNPIPGMGVSPMATQLVSVPHHAEACDEDGRFLLSGLCPGAYTFGVTLPGERVITRLDGGPTVEVEAGQTLENVELTFDMPGTLSIDGRIIGADGKPAAGMNVHASARPQDNVSHMAIAEEDGTFRLNGLKEIEYTLTFVDQGTQETRTVQAGSTGIEIRLGALGGLAGRALDARTGQPLTDFEVSEHPTRYYGPDGLPVFTRVQAPDGKFRVGNLQSGRSGILVRAAGYAPAVAYGEVREQQTTEGLEVRLEPGTTVEGRVLSPSGEPVTGARVYFQCDAPGLDGRLEPECARTGPDGAFRSGAVPATAKRVSAYAQGYAPAVAPLRQEAGYVNTVELRMSAGGRVSGVVRSNGAPLAKAEVAVGHADPGVLRTQTDAEGRYELRGVAAGEHDIEVRPEHFMESSTPERVQNGRVRVGDGGEVGLDFAFDTWDTEIRGQVVADEPARAAGVRIDVRREVGGTVETWATRTDDAGRFSLPGIAPGEAVIRTSHDFGGAASEPQPIVVDERAPTIVEIPAP